MLKITEPTQKLQSLIVTAKTIHETKYEPPLYAVPQIIPEGLTLLAGRPKIGKSMLALEIALAITAKDFDYCLGDKKPQKGNVLYCSLEDGEPTLNERMHSILTPNAKPTNELEIATTWPRLDQGGIELLTTWATTRAKPRAIILDTMAAIIPRRNGNDSMYEGDYRALQTAHDLATRMRIAIMMLTHTRKMEAEDPFDEILGSRGQTACADTLIAIRRNNQGTTMHLRGRRIEEREHALAFNPNNRRWTILGDAAEIHRSKTRGKILEAMKDHAATTPSEIAAITELPEGRIQQHLLRMLKAGEIIKTGRGHYNTP